MFSIIYDGRSSTLVGSDVPVQEILETLLDTGTIAETAQRYGIQDEDVKACLAHAIARVSGSNRKGEIRCQ